MDKVKIVLALLKKHHFWVMTGAVVLLGFVGWLIAASKLWAEYDTGKKKILAQFTALDNINKEPRENQKWIDGLDTETKQLKVKVATAWEHVYNDQKDHVLKWPELPGDSKATLEALGPQEKIPSTICKVYWNYIRGEFPRLLEIVDARKYNDEKAGPEKKGAGAAAAAHDYKVIWDENNQKEIDETLDWPRPPDSQEVRDTQEDLWVYRALLTILSKLNDRATGTYNAKVKEIQRILIGKAAADAFQAGMAEGKIKKIEVAGAPPSTAPVASPPPVGRYVNQIPSAAGGAPPGDGAPPADGAAGPAEFKAMPVVMRLVMDQREISRLLVECANSPLPVEVRQFRVRPRNATFDSSGRPSAGPTTPGRKEEKEPITYDVTVEVQGIIYIFNPPNRAKLGDVAAAEARPAPPADAPPADGQPAAIPSGAAESPPASGAAENPAKTDAGGGPDAAPDGADAAPPAETENPEAMKAE